MSLSSSMHLIFKKIVFKIYLKFAKINQIHSISYTKVSHETWSGNKFRWEKRKEPH